MPAEEIPTLRVVPNPYHRSKIDFDWTIGGG